MNRKLKKGSRYRIRPKTMLNSQIVSVLVLLQQYIYIQYTVYISCWNLPEPPMRCSQTSKFLSTSQQQQQHHHHNNNGISLHMLRLVPAAW